MKQFYVHNKLKKHKKAIKSLKAFIYKIQLKSEGKFKCENRKKIFLNKNRVFGHELFFKQKNPKSNAKVG